VLLARSWSSWVLLSLCPPFFPFAGCFVLIKFTRVSSILLSFFLSFRASSFHLSFFLPCRVSSILLSFFHSGFHQFFSLSFIVSLERRIWSFQPLTKQYAQKFLSQTCRHWEWRRRLSPTLKLMSLNLFTNEYQVATCHKGWHLIWIRVCFWVSSQFVCQVGSRWTGDHPQEDLPKFGYM
jgi:hypothetical protein